MNSETKQTIQELRKCVDSIRRHLPGDGEGMLVFGTGVAIIRSNYPDWIEANVNNNEEILLMYTISHESVHLFQTLSSEFVFNIGLGFSELVADIQRNKKQDIPEEKWLPKSRELFDLYYNLLESETDGISALHLIEAHAVIEGFRGAFSRYAVEGLVFVIQKAHNLSLLYSDLIGRILEELGFDFTFNVLPKMCWLSLQDKNPVSKFLNYFDLLKRYSIEEVLEKNCVDFCALLNIDSTEITKTLKQRNAWVGQHPSKELWGPYLEKIELEDNEEILLEFFMHPGKVSRSKVLKKQYFMPPLTIFDDNRYRLNGPYRDDGWSVAKPLIEITAQYIETLSWLCER